jgi:lycopene cyclase domain-containing protein
MGGCAKRKGSGVFGEITYLVWLLCFIGLPLIILWARYGAALWQQRRALAWVTVGSLLGGWIWDALAVEVGLWFYDPAHLVGWWWGGLPLEEWLWIAGVTLLFGGLTVALATHIGVQPDEEPHS